jgi:hypothetical protein
MNNLPMADDAPRSNDSTNGNDNKSAGGWRHAAMADPDLIIIVAFCVIGLLMTFNLVFRFPSFAPSVEQIAQFLG